jgi:serine phosphatase RsbU (regulator of sigma subunit)
VSTNTSLASPPRLLWTGHAPAPERLYLATAGRWEIAYFDPSGNVREQVASASVVAMGPDGLAEDAELLSELHVAVASSATVGVRFHDSGDGPQADDGWVTLPADCSSEQLGARLEAVRLCREKLRQLDQQVEELRRSQAGADHKLEALDEEMRLAARLQRDFLPRRLPEIGDVRFAVLFRPASWVSGDMYDVDRLDETHLGFHVVDAVGHGMPAALLTMFIKKSLQTKRIEGNSYRIVPPHEALSVLNGDICDQNLSRCQFCTAVYGVLDTSTLELSYCRAGHPEPILVRSDGTVESLTAEGCLLGIFEEPDFTSTSLQLGYGDRLILYSDGVEDALVCPGQEQHEAFVAQIASLADRPREEMLMTITSWIDDKVDAREPDDVTMVVIDIDRD